MKKKYKKMKDKCTSLSDCDMTLLAPDGLNIGRMREWCEQFDDDTPLFVVDSRGNYCKFRAEEEHGALVLATKGLES